MNNNSEELYTKSSPLTAYFMPRPQVDAAFDRATNCKLVYVIAGAGYGKTQAVYHYIMKQENAVVRWMQLTENDNAGSRYWESLTHTVFLDNPELAVKLRELGFPETLARFNQFSRIVKTTEHRSHKTFLVLDDFHLIHSKQALVFAERCAHLNIPGACVIIISRTEPEINAVSLFSKGKAAIVTEDDLRFTEPEIAEFFQKQGIPFSAKEIPLYSEATKGWALAIKLLSLVLKRIPKNLDLALGAMKQNIFKLMETEAWGDLPDNIKKALVKTSLVSDLPLTPLYEFRDVASINDIPQITSFVWYDSFSDDFRVHPLYLEFLQSKESLLTDEEKQEMYGRAAIWCSENSFYTDAMKYNAKSRRYEDMCETLLSYPFKLPHETSEYFLRIIEEITPDDKDKDDKSVLLLKNFFAPLMLMGTGDYKEAEKRCLAVIREWENDDAPFSSYLIHSAYSTLAYINMYACTVEHRYDFAKYMKKSVEYFKRSSLAPIKTARAFIVPDIRSYACAVGEGASLRMFSQYLEAVKAADQYVAQSALHMYYGFYELVACELAFYKNQPDRAKTYAYSAIEKAREKKQYSIEIVAEQYLLRIAMQEGNLSLTKTTLLQITDHLDNPDFWNRQVYYDLITGYFYILLGITDLVPSWLHMDEADMTDEIRIPTRELLVSIKYYIACNRYDQAHAVLSKSYPREPQERFFFGELLLALLTAVVKINTGDIAGALTEFERAYNLSFQGEFEMFFIELGKVLNPLVAAAQKQADCQIPDEWLKMINYKASAYRKKISLITNAMKKEKNIEETHIKLSNREKELLYDLYIGLSREEIAATRYLTINTVKTIIQSLFIKLDANSNVDAVRIAIEKKLLD